MEKVKYNKFIQELMEILPGGVFLTVSTGKQLNTMTIGWGNIGYIWGKPIFMVAVRDSRYTYSLIEKTDEFTVSIPFNGTMKDELKYCGSKSGRNFDKFKECNLTTISGQKVDTPVIEGCKLHYECKIKFKQKMDENNLGTDFIGKWYPEKDYHTLYFGEIVSCYIDERF